MPLQRLVQQGLHGNGKPTAVAVNIHRRVRHQLGTLRPAICRTWKRRLGVRASQPNLSCPFVRLPAANQVVEVNTQVYESCPATPDRAS